MIYAIDIDDGVIKSKLIERLTNEGHITIDCAQENTSDVLASHKKKVILSNSTQAELFIRFIEGRGDTDKIEFFGDEFLLSRIMAVNIEDIVEELNLEQICLKNGKELYLIKNLESLCIIVRLTTKDAKPRESIYNVLYRILKENSF